MSDTDCLSPQTILALAAGEPPGAEARAHLTTCDDCRRRLAVAAGPIPAPRLSPTLASPVPLRTAPPSVGRYRLVRELGRGAMGVVMLAEDTLLARQVALKAVGPASADGGLAQQVSSEARAIARLQHPNVVGLYDVLEQGGQVYLAMEYVEGGDLQRWLIAARTPEQIVDLFLQAAAGLEAAHEAGVVHRDFKPANVLVGSDGRARVSDFGLATMQGEHDSVVRGSLVGTPAYMAPEQLAGKLAGAAADQFAFCAALFEALTRQRPFAGDDLLALREAVLQGPPQMPPQLAPSVAAVLRRGLATDPKDRFASIRDLAAALRAAGGVRRRRRQWATGGGAALLSVAALVVLLRPADPCRLEATRLSRVWPPADAQAVPAVVRTSLEQTAQRWGEAFTGQCRAWAEKKVSEPEWQRTRGCLEAALDDVESVAAAAKVAGEGKPASLLLQYVAQPAACASPANPARSGLPVEPTNRQRVTDTLVALVDVAAFDAKADGAAAMRRASEAVELAVASNHAPTHARALIVKARLEYNAAHHTDATRSLERAVSLAQSSGAVREVARAELQAAFEPCGAGTAAECLPRLERARHLVDALDDPWLRAYLQEMTADADYTHPATVETVAQVVEGWKRLPGATAELARTQRRYARLLVDTGASAEGLALSLELQPEKAPLGDLRACEVAITRALAQVGLGQVNEGLRTLSDVQAAAERLKLPEMRADALANRAEVLMGQARFAEALALLPADTESLYLQDKRVHALLEVGRFDEAATALAALSFPAVYATLSEYLRYQVHYRQVLLALARRDGAVLAQVNEWLGPDPDPSLAAAALTTRGLETEARALLRAQPEKSWMLKVELAQREQRWADALALLDANAAEVKAWNRPEAAARRAYTEVMLADAPAEPCRRLAAQRALLDNNRYALFPNERLRLDADVKSRCR